MVLVTSSLVLYPRMISTNFMIGTGFIKCILTRSGFETTAPIWVIEMEEVLVDMVSGEQASLNCLKIESFKSIFSVAAQLLNQHLLLRL
jgi:hypothetical protein